MRWTTGVNRMPAGKIAALPVQYAYAVGIDVNDLPEKHLFVTRCFLYKRVTKPFAKPRMNKDL